MSNFKVKNWDKVIEVYPCLRGKKKFILENVADYLDTIGPFWCITHVEGLIVSLLLHSSVMVDGIWIMDSSQFVKDVTVSKVVEPKRRDNE